MKPNLIATGVMSVVHSDKQIRVQCRMSQSTFNRVLGFLQGALTTALVGLIVSLPFLQMQTVGLWSAVIVVSALLTILLLRGVPINQINVGDRFSIDFEISDSDGKE
jgi:uncharacterized membrane protein